MSNFPMRFYYGHGEEIDPTVADQLERFAEDCELEVRAINEGIGAYEFWGSPGFDSRAALEVTSDDYAFRLNFPPSIFERAMANVREAFDYVTRTEEASADFGGREVSGNFKLAIFDLRLDVDPKSSPPKVIGADIVFAWEEI